MSDWISVDERLPESEDWVVVWYQDKDGDYFPTVGAYRSYGSLPRQWVTDVDNSELAYPPEKITHWMPLPPPPQAICTADQGDPRPRTP